MPDVAISIHTIRLIHLLEVSEIEVLVSMSRADFFTPFSFS